MDTTIKGKGPTGRPWVLVTLPDCKPVATDTRRKDGAGNEHRVYGGTPPQSHGRVGSVWTDRGSYFPSVLSLQWIHEGRVPKKGKRK